MPETKQLLNEADHRPIPDVPGPRLSAGRSRHQVRFFCEAKEASRVFLVGDFNNWDPAATPMHRMPDGRWMLSLELSHGYHQHLFLVDGKPRLNPKATGITRNERNEPVSLVAVS